MTRHFERELNDLKTNLIRMGNLVWDQIDAACGALFESDQVRALQVIQRDAEVDEFDTLIDRDCQRIFATTQPVAADLRLLMSALKINSQLERIGDIAVNIAEREEALRGHSDFLRTTRLKEMAEIARIMLHDSLDAFIYGDASLAARVLESDDVVDNLDRQIFHTLLAEMCADQQVIVPAAHAMILTRHLERLADHATNIAEDVIFLVNAKLVKHNAYTYRE